MRMMCVRNTSVNHHCDCTLDVGGPDAAAVHAFMLICFCTMISIWVQHGANCIACIAIT
jgi:hypothetical protein